MLHISKQVQPVGIENPKSTLLVSAYKYSFLYEKFVTQREFNLKT